MPKNPLDVLKSGLTNLKNLTKTRKDDLLACLHRREKISASDEEEWLDNAANPVDEEAIVVLLENASDYERGLTRLNSQRKLSRWNRLISQIISLVNSLGKFRFCSIYIHIMNLQPTRGTL